MYPSSETTACQASRRYGAAAVLAILALLSCAPNAASAAPAGPLPLENLHIDADLQSGFAAEGNHLAFMVRESHQSNTDLNGDGDTLDYVIHLYDHGKGKVTNLGLTVPWDPNPTRPFIKNGYMTFRVDEARQGGTDLNSDGDALDYVPHVLDLTTGTLTNLAIASASFVHNTGEHALFLVDEETLGSDLNGDGDQNDLVPRAYRFDTGSIQNLALAVPRQPHYLWTAGSNFSTQPLLVSEEHHGLQDLNGDGDYRDNVLFLYNSVTGKKDNLEVAVPKLSRQVGEELVEVRVTEANQGYRDLNGDGDTNDVVLHLYLPQTGKLLNLKQAVPTTNTPVVVDGGRASFLVDEAAQAATDLNGDGDTTDAVLHHFSIPHGVQSIGLAASAPGQLNGDLLDFSVAEVFNGTDFNNDGDTSDLATFRYDLAKGKKLTVPFASGLYQYRVSEALMSLKVWEDQMQADLNGDGDWDDDFKFAFDPIVGTATRLGESASIAYDMTDRALGIMAWESKEGIDANGDGDTTDRIARVFDAGIGQLLDLGVAGPPPQIQDLFVVVLVYETEEGHDLNGDLDTDDFILHITTLPALPTPPLPPPFPPPFPPPSSS